jgi:serine/threonine-protein kinase
LPDAGTSGEIAGYRLDGYIGGSDTGAVYLARKERRDRQVALKVLAPERAGEDAFRARLIRDSQTATSVQHPNIIPVYQAGDADGTVFVAMRYAPGGDTRSLLNRLGPLPLDLAGTIVTQIGSALDAAHAQGLIHRDVKPANILLGAGPGQLYLSDFGMAPDTSLKEVITAGQLTSRLDYVAPEQIEGQALDGRADLYSLACVGFELLCGTPLFEADQGLTVMYAQLYAPPPAASARRNDLPAAVDQVLAKALAKNPADRYPTCTQFAQELSEALSRTGQPPTRAPSRPPTHVPPAPAAAVRREPAPAEPPPAGSAAPKSAADEPDHGAPGREQPPAGPGEPSGGNEAPPADPQQSSRRRRPVKLLVAAGAVVIVAAAAVAIGVGATTSGRPAAHAAVASRPTATSAATSAPTPSPSPSSSPALSASAQAAVVSKLLSSSAAARQQLLGAVNEVASCTNLASAVGAIQGVVSQRGAEYRQASVLSASALSQGAAVKTDLVAMFRTSLTADQDYLTWARQQLTAGCTAPLQSGAYSAAYSAAQPAGTAKEAFIQLWNPVAAKYGIAPQSSSSI